MTQEQAFALLNTEFLHDPKRFAHPSIDGVNLTAAGEFLIDEHNVEDDEAYQWAYDWAEFRESEDITSGTKRLDYK